MTVGYVLRYWPTLSETFVAREIATLRATGTEIEVVALGRRADGAMQDLAPDIEVHRPPRGRGSRELWPGMLRAMPHAEGRRALGWLLGRLRPKDALRALWVADTAVRRGWNRLHAHFAGEAAVWARGAATIASIPYSVTVHGSDLFLPRPDFRELVLGARPLITVCEHHRDWLRHRYDAVAQVIRCGVDPGRYALADPAVSSSWVCVARDVRKKGLDDLALAMPPGRLRLVSDAVRLGGAHILAGPAPPSRVPAILAQAGAFVLPCRVAEDGDRDGIPVALMEAMAAGLPVVTAPVAGIPELVDDSVGWWTDGADPAALARVLREVERHPQERMRRGRAARARIVGDRWTLERQAVELRDVWDGSTSAVAP